eukprot:scaffold459_cov249-Pinguiococcus_pyrenoidosus.AAC.3
MGFRLFALDGMMLELEGFGVPNPRRGQRRKSLACAARPAIEPMHRRRIHVCVACLLCKELAA